MTDTVSLPSCKTIPSSFLSLSIIKFVNSPSYIVFEHELSISSVTCLLLSDFRF